MIRIYILSSSQMQILIIGIILEGGFKYGYKAHACFECMIVVASLLFVLIQLYCFFITYIYFFFTFSTLYFLTTDITFYSTSI